MKLSGWFLGVALAGALAGCSGAGDVVPQPTLPEAQFLDMAHDLGAFKNTPDDGLIQSAKAMCADFTDSPTKPLGLIAQQGATPERLADWRQFLTYAVTAYCPDQQQHLPTA